MLHNAKSLSTAPGGGGRPRVRGGDDEEDDPAEDRKPLWQLMFLDEVPDESRCAPLHGGGAASALDQHDTP